MLTDSEWLSQKRWLEMVNDSGEEIPSFAVVKIDSVDDDGVHHVVQPDKDGVPDDQPIAFNGPVPIQADGKGVITRDAPMYAYYETDDGDPENPEVWGPKADSWKLHKDHAGFLILGGATQERVQVVPHDPKPLFARIDDYDDSEEFVKYAWTQMRQTEEGDWEETPDGLTGDLEEHYAFERNNKPDVRIGDIVQLFRGKIVEEDPPGQLYIFEIETIEFPAQLDDVDDEKTGNPYAWHELSYAEDGGYGERAGGRSGTVDTNAAYERNTNPDVPLGDYVTMQARWYVGVEDEQYAFDYETSPGNSRPKYDNTPESGRPYDMRDYKTVKMTAATPLNLGGIKLNKRPGESDADAKKRYDGRMKLFEAPGDGSINVLNNDSATSNAFERITTKDGQPQTIKPGETGAFLYNATGPRGPSWTHIQWPCTKHPLLGEEHTDTVTDTPSPGGLIRGVSASPNKWQQLYIGDPGQVLTVVPGGTDIFWTDPYAITGPTGPLAPLGDDILAVNFENVPGISEQSSREDHLHESFRIRDDSQAVPMINTGHGCMILTFRSPTFSVSDDGSGAFSVQSTPGTLIQDVSSTSSPGSSLKFAAEDHVHGGKSAIVPVQIDGLEQHVALYCVEAPEVLFTDLIQTRIAATEVIGSAAIDPLFLQTCEPDSIRVTSIVTNLPEPVGAYVHDNLVILLRGSESTRKPITVTATITGTRKGRKNLRFARHTKEEAERNNAFWVSWKYGIIA